MFNIMFFKKKLTKHCIIYIQNIVSGLNFKVKYKSAT